MAKQTTQPEILIDTENLIEPPKISRTAKLFRVKTDGYTEQFSSYQLARRMYDKIKKVRMDDEQEFSLKIEAFEEKEWLELDSITATEEMYDWM